MKKWGFVIILHVILTFTILGVIMIPKAKVYNYINEYAETHEWSDYEIISNVKLKYTAKYETPRYARVIEIISCERGEFQKYRFEYYYKEKLWYVHK